MARKKTNIITCFAVLVFITSIAAGYFWGSRLIISPQSKPANVYRSAPNFFNPRVSLETILIKDKEYLCGDLEKISEEIAPEELLHLDRKALAERFPASEGWVVNFSNPGFLTLTMKSDEFCPLHRNCRHIGLYQGLVAVYEGPLGFNGKLLRSENIPVESLNPDFRIMLEQAMDVNKLSHTTAESLRQELEFNTDESLNAALDNLDEHSE
ncbi:MAG: hypothetical protein WC601_04320 [Desulfotomaculaceae bacterium]